MGIPTLIQEQNSYAGVTNKLLAQKACKICVAYEGMEKFFPAEKIIMTGNPVRQNLLGHSILHANAVKYFGLNPEKKTILILGGSLGARTINQTLTAGLDIIRTHPTYSLSGRLARYTLTKSEKPLQPLREKPYVTRISVPFRICM